MGPCGLNPACGIFFGNASHFPTRDVTLLHCRGCLQRAMFHYRIIFKWVSINVLRLLPKQPLASELTIKHRRPISRRQRNYKAKAAVRKRLGTVKKRAGTQRNAVDSADGVFLQDNTLYTTNCIAFSACRVALAPPVSATKSISPVCKSNYPSLTRSTLLFGATLQSFRLPTLKIRRANSNSLEALALNAPRASPLRRPLIGTCCRSTRNAFNV